MHIPPACTLAFISFWSLTWTQAIMNSLNDCSSLPLPVPMAAIVMAKEYTSTDFV